eukprot:3385758-Lingulodinium_polyedra.AAC.1
MAHRAIAARRRRGRRHRVKNHPPPRGEGCTATHNADGLGDRHSAHNRGRAHAPHQAEQPKNDLRGHAEPP